MKLLVAGGAGFIGSNFVRQRVTDFGDDVIVLDKLTYAGRRENLEGLDVEFVHAGIEDPDATLLFVGYQGVGTLGAHLQAGAKTVRLDGQVHQVRCMVRSISGFSAHADECELLDWLRAFGAGRQPGDPGYPRKVFLVHGDPEAQVALEPKVRDLGYATHVPHWHQRVVLD